MVTISDNVEKRYIERELSSDSLSPIPNEVHGSVYHDKMPSKFIRVLTVLAYLLCVSFAAIILSLYYIFIWSEQMEKDLKLNNQRIIESDDFNFKNSSR